MRDCLGPFLGDEFAKCVRSCESAGAGLAGTVQAYVPLDMLDAFKAEMQSVFGEKSCYVLSVRSAGGTKVTIE